MGMTQRFTFTLLGFVFFFSSSPLRALVVPDFPVDMIYGRDNRVEVDQYDNPAFIAKARSVALKVPKTRLVADRNNPDRLLFSQITLKQRMSNLCENERFTEQVPLGDCSGFLIDAQTLMTAGHCIADQKDCEKHWWAFGYKEGTSWLQKSQVYSCKKIKSRKYVRGRFTFLDYAVIELDRKVKGYTPLKLRKKGRVNSGTELVVLGHPLGLPMKASDNAFVGIMNEEEQDNFLQAVFLRRYYFTTNLDVFAGNSGSPVFNKKTGVVEGMLVQGDSDFVYSPERECLESHKRSNSYLEAYERVLRINVIPGL